MKAGKKILYLISLVVLGFLARLDAMPRETKGNAKLAKQILVYAKRDGSKVAYRIGDQQFTGPDLNYALGELHIDATADSRVAVVLEDSMTIRDIKSVPEMALKAGFRDVRVFVYWKGTGNMAEVLFGPVLKFKKNAVIE